ncbi:glycosyltransferase family 4 protein [Elizabethkingia bruuniana]|uniref:Glycosyltransferase family 4 protein n=1 Tax=Elizabethkingia bruuniana TaxID=1756149 RepID=A0A7T7UVK7_9FLAO|nr:glycosyltransferase family 4 protein [Elizabethkingia bruuniana]KGO10455.1 glycosyl transferase family 1 [Elizabethkingia miricola]AQX83631.1 glycosyl transferase family 1 [Elizabethkingia bruuniana]KUY22254.1 glycosyl transferase family 1 [Elizabethkingia bruuniana]OPB62465.1 glycosyl transferase family 1 [Elizabethkingia bruuniana]QDZ63599.1 glycosyltransferase family 4 protein [Elizabethkingia bruuniana]
MKVVYNILGTFNSGGMERVLANKANYLVNSGYDITIITTDQKGRSAYFEMNPKIKYIDLDINYRDDIDKGVYKKSLSYLLKQKKHKQRLEGILYDLKADVVISMFDHDVSFVHDIKDGSKKIVEIHFSRFKRLQYGRKGIWKIIDKIRSNNDYKLVQKYDRFVVLTNEDKGYWGNMPNIEVIPNANSFTSSEQSSLSYKRVIAVGRYDYQKGFDELIKMWERIHVKNPEWRLDIFGDGPLKEELQCLIKKMNLSETINLYPSTKKIKEEYLKSSIMVLTSRYEGLGMVLLEAQTCGLPLVAYACKCGPKDIIQDGINGYLVPERDSQMMVEKILNLIGNYELRKEMGHMGKKFSENFSENRIMKKWVNLFNEVTKENQ